MSLFHRRLRTGLTACVVLLAAAGSSRAQDAFDDGILPPRAVAWRLGERGFSGIGRPRFDGRAYVVEAFNPNGARVRLFVDAQDGAILGRQRLDDAPMAIVRPAPGYGWTEEDAMPRRPMRQAERPMPPADIPVPESRGVLLRGPAPRALEPMRPEGAFATPGRPPADPNPQGVNPDRRGPGEPARRLARVGNPTRNLDAKPRDANAQTRIVPEAPKLRPVETAKNETKLETKPGSPSTPAAVQPPSDGPAAEPAARPADIKPADVRTSDAGASDPKPGDAAWKNPPEARRNVRVIGGATLVPGTPGKEPPAP